MIKAFFICLFVYLLAGLFNPIFASKMFDDNFILDLQKQNDNTIQNSNQDVKGITSDDPRIITGDNYTIEQGFSYVFGLNDFVFSVSPLAIDYGPFLPTNPITRLEDISINTGNAFSYSVYAIEDHELMLIDGKTITIPSTTCDDGLCSIIFSSNWTNTLTYGFGYSCKPLDNYDCDFTKENYFRRFPNEIDNENPESAISGVGGNKKSRSEIIYKVNTSTTQPKGLYANTITYIAIPGY
jgi:hypothetical protein